MVRGQALIALDRGAEARVDLEAVLDTFDWATTEPNCEAHNR